MHHTIEVHNLSYKYPDGHAALDGVTLRIEPGEKVGLVGPNGAGKSTLILHLNGIFRCTSGSVHVCDVKICEETLGKVRAAVGLVFQDPDDQLFSPTVFEDVAFGPMHMGMREPEVRRRVAAALAAVNMADYEQRVSHHLSTGEKKRIAIASVLSMDPEILVMDEPSAGLDPRAHPPPQQDRADRADDGGEHELPHRRRPERDEAAGTRERGLGAVVPE